MVVIGKELGLDVNDKMKVDLLREKLASHAAFKTISKLEKLGNRYNVHILFLPKYHCEMSAIEGLWCSMKAYVRKHSEQSFGKMIELIDESRRYFEEKKLDRKLQRRFWKTLHAYDDGQDYKQLPEEDDAIIAYESELHFYIKHAEYYLQNNNEDAAMENYNKVLEFAGDKTDYAIEHYTYVLELIPDSNPSVAHYVSKLKQSLYSMERYVYQSIGGCYQNLGEYDSAKKNFLLSLRIVLKMYPLDYKHIDNLLLFIGGTYLLIKNEDAALINYQLSEQFILDIDSSMSAAQYYQLARLYFIFKRDYDLAFLELFITYVSKR
ncbi:unnamed protein product [Didymodactylos carnosus]|uniref:Tetratricopeptide repeat protein n=1 Tax=Didymodactylos carnosus TaxID=1234261 RepID=A0A815KXQ2_9BILA|nr:unnamed protein product [Didymodactylos carnosus]CAF4289938.1 unnamed protein product [Didymodactylos carnosus]